MWGISSVDSDGSEHYYGPFEVGQSYGELSSLEPIAWNDVRAELDARMAKNGYVRDRGLGYRKVASSVEASLSSDEATVIEFSVSEDGLYRIVGSELPESWQSVSKRDVAVLDASGAGVVRYVVAKGKGKGLNRTLGASGEIYFYGQSPDEQAGLYADASVYRLVKNPYQALNAPVQDTQGLSDGFSETYIEHSEVELDKTYVLSSKADDPWVDAVVVGYSDQPGLYGTLVPVEGDAQWSGGSSLHIQAGRSSALSAVDSDGDGQQDAEHIAQGLVLSGGGLEGVGTEQATGSGEWDIEFSIPAEVALDRQSNGDVLVGGSFTAGSGYAFSEVHIDSIGLSYTRQLVSKAGDDHLSFSGSSEDALGYGVSLEPVI